MDEKKRDELANLILEFGKMSIELGIAIKEIGENDKFEKVRKERDQLVDKLFNYIDEL